MTAVLTAIAVVGARAYPWLTGDFGNLFANMDQPLGLSSGRLVCIGAMHLRAPLVDFAGCRVDSPRGSYYPFLRRPNRLTLGIAVYRAVR